MYLAPRMARPATVEFIDTLKLTPEARERLRREMLAVEEHAFVKSARVSADEMWAARRQYYAWCTDPEICSRYQRSVLYRIDGQLVAFFHAYVQLLDVEGQQVEVIRAVSATLPGHRAGGLIGQAYLRTVADYARRHMFVRTPRYYAARCASPIMYEFIGRRVRHLFPGPDPDVDPEMRRVFRAIHGKDDDWLQSEVSGTFEPAETRAQIASRSSRHARFFCEVNPRYAEGTTLRILVRVNGSDLLYAMAVSAGLAAIRPLRRFKRR